MSDERIKDAVRAQFGAAAQSYVTSTVHARGEDLARLVELASASGSERVLDVATGGGHTALAFARVAREVVASDFTPRMLEAAREFVAKEGVSNIRFELADAEQLPFEDGSFDIVTTRRAPHHFSDPQRFVREASRVLRVGGLFLLADQMPPDDPELDEFMNRFERWRDPSHVRAYTTGQWRAWIESAGMSVIAVDPLMKNRPYVFDEWAERMNMPESEKLALERWLLSAPPRCAEFFEITASDGRVRSLIATIGIIAARRV